MAIADRFNDCDFKAYGLWPAPARGSDVASRKLPKWTATMSRPTAASRRRARARPRRGRRGRRGRRDRGAGGGVALGCSFAQGWLYGRAVPLPEFLTGVAAGTQHPDDVITSGASAG